MNIRKLLFIASTVILVSTNSNYADETAARKALVAMNVGEGFSAKFVASEPEIRQPLSITFDSRGRMWVIQYLQYPTPAGLKPVKVDQYLRTTYDKSPEPPPRGPKGADRITICEDLDGDGRMDTFKDFVSDLNLCSGMAIGYDGVFVVQPPYLLFYGDKNHDDVPDGDPEVLLKGFGMEDAHAFANSLTWGPDGWLYGAQGSTSTANIRGIEFQQGIWRYHPRTHVFELFAEGGGNTWGLDFDDEGEVFAGTNADEKMLHMVQGAYYIKNFGKHGELHNPYAFGFFDHVPYSGYRGLHISIGGIVYHGGAFPKDFEGAYIFGNTLDRAVYWANLHPKNSTFTASFGGLLLKADDALFRPVDCQTGPDGAVYIADWCDQRANHVDAIDTWDRSNGRIYKIEAVNTLPVKSSNRLFDVGKLSSNQLVDLLSNKNDWFIREARRILAERRDPKILPRLTKQIFESKNAHLQLQSLWALYVSGGFNDELAEKILRHSNAAVRKWGIRFLGDAKSISFAQCEQLIALAKSETNAPVRAQLACSIKRLDGSDALPVLRELFFRTDAADEHIPLLLWWALENKAISDRAEVLKMFSSSPVRQAPLVRQHILERLARRYVAEGKEEDFAACVKLLEMAEGNEREPLLRGIEKGLVGKQAFEKATFPLRAWLDKEWPPDEPGLVLVSIGSRLGDTRAQKAAFGFVASETRPVADRIKLIEIFGQTRLKESVPMLLVICEKSTSPELKGAAMAALRQFPDLSVGQKVLELFRSFNPEFRTRATDMLSSRSPWSELLVKAVEDGMIKADEVSRERVRQMMSFKDAALGARIEKVWGKMQTEASAEKQVFISTAKLSLEPTRVREADFPYAKGNPVEGKTIFLQACAACHKLFGEGNTIGPDLTGMDRKNTDFMLANIVNPSGYIRPEYVSYQAETKDDQVVTGLMVESTPAAVVLLDSTNQRHTIPRDQIKDLKESQISLMPEGLLEALKPQQLMDLFSYLQK